MSTYVWSLTSRHVEARALCEKQWVGRSRAEVTRACFVVGAECFTGLRPTLTIEGCNVLTESLIKNSLCHYGERVASSNVHFGEKQEMLLFSLQHVLLPDDRLVSAGALTRVAWYLGCHVLAGVGQAGEVTDDVWGGVQKWKGTALARHQLDVERREREYAAALAKQSEWIQRGGLISDVPIMVSDMVKRRGATLADARARLALDLERFNRDAPK